jgi:hypothetical protein
MNTKLLLAVALMLTGSAIAAGWVLRSRSQRRAHVLAPKANPHAAGIDREMSAINAMYKAPAGATPCDTAWNAFQAGEEAGRKGSTPVVVHLAPHDQFLSRCRELPEAVQACLGPTHYARHRQECDHIKPPDEVLKPMFELKQMGGVRPDERDADRQFMSTRPR